MDYTGVMKKNQPLPLLDVFLVAGALAVLLALALFAGALHFFDLKVFDRFLDWRGSPKEGAEVRLVEFDDPTIEKIGYWPVSRNIIADGLITLRELGARRAVIDIEYSDPSPRGVSGEYLGKKVPVLVHDEFAGLTKGVDDLFGALKAGKIRLKDAGDFAADWSTAANDSRDRILDSIGKIAIDNDTYFGNAARLFGHVTFAVNLTHEVRPPLAHEQYRSFVGTRLTYPKVTKWEGLTPAGGFVPPVSAIGFGGDNLGFDNADPDSDGVRRRVQLVRKVGDLYFPQLAFAAWLEKAGRPEVRVTASGLDILDVKNAAGKVGTLHVPLDNGALMLNWPNKTYEKSFNEHIPFGELYDLGRNWSGLEYNLRAAKTWGFFDGFSDSDRLFELLDLTGSHLEDALLGQAADFDFLAWAAQRQELLDLASRYFAAKFPEKLKEQVAGLPASPQLEAGQRADFEKVAAALDDLLPKTAHLLEDIKTTRARLTSLLDGTTVLIGHTVTGSTDTGINPFDPNYKNVGTHATVLHTLDHRSFLLMLPDWAGLLAGLVLAGGMLLLLRRLSPSISTVAGLSILFAVFLAAWLLFWTSGLYFPVVFPLLAVLVTFLSMTFVQFFNTVQEKGFLRTAFSRYLSDEVIKDIIANPDKLKLGGEKKTMTALFTDIKGFSTLSEAMDPVDLVRLLNEYLTLMSDRILEEKGTIDKYEGDAIIAFFGAPLDLADHAVRACRSALIMKKAEAKLNSEFEARGEPTRLYTRIGINSGEMVVGNMGTDKKMDYTMIGNAVNLAARLEGVNKPFGTWICVSQMTLDLTGEAFCARKIGRIRVVGIRTPVTIYELLEESHLASDSLKSFASRSTAALETFWSGQWSQAIAAFDALLAERPDDPPSLKYLKLAHKYLQNPPPADFDGVINLTEK